jgi:hypothetical protein
MRNVVIWIWAISVCSLSVVNSQGISGTCEQGGGYTLEEANMSLGIAQAALTLMPDCDSPDDRDFCYGIYEGLLTAETHLTYIMQSNEMHGCMPCDLTAAYNIALELDSAVSDLFASDFRGDNSIYQRVSFRLNQMLERPCPDLNGSWYQSNDSDLSIQMNYDAETDLYFVDLSKGTTSERAYLQVTNYNQVKIYETNNFGGLYNNNRNISWGNGEWIRVTANIPGRWTMDGKDVFRVTQTANGQYQMIIESAPTMAALGTHTSGDLYAKFWTTDHIYFVGYIKTNIPAQPQIKIYLKLENDVFYMDTSDTVYIDKTGATVMTKG